MSNNTEAIVSDDIVQPILSPQQSREELLKLVDTARAHGGKVVGYVAWEEGDDICPRWRFPFPPPPRFNDLIGGLIKEGRTFRVFPIGIPFPDELMIDVRTRAHRF